MSLNDAGSTPSLVRIRARTVWAWMGVALATALALACGGGGVGSGGTGAPVAEGTVTGFGSVIVDGVRYDDAQATVTIERVGGAEASASLQLGHRVAMSFDGSTAEGGVARSIALQPEVIGPIESVSSSGLRVLGQVVNINTDATAGPVTQFGAPWTGLSSLSAGAGVEVHAVLERDAAGQATLRATRLEPVSTLAGLRVAGVVSAASGSSLRLGGLTVRLGAGQSLPSDGEYVVVFASVSSWDAGSQSLTAGALSQRERLLADADDYLGGTISRLDTGAQTFEIQGVLVRYGQAQLDTGTTLRNGVYVRVRGRSNGPGVVVATRISQRSNESEIELHGTVLNWDATGLSFILRGQRVDVSGLDPAARACLSDQRYVEVKGRGTASGVVATSLECDDSDSGNSGPSGAVLNLKGVVTQLKLGERSFLLQRRLLPTVTVTWSERTRFDLDAAPWAEGLAVEVEGDVVGSTLSARRIKVDD